MLTTRTGGFPIGFRQGWTEWFKDIDGMIAWAKSQNLCVIDLGGDCVTHLPAMRDNGMRVGTADLRDWHGLISEDPSASLEANERFIAQCAEFGVQNYFAVMLPKDPALSLIHISEPTRLGMISYAVFCLKKIFLMIRRPPRSTHCISSAASDVYKRQGHQLCPPEKYPRTIYGSAHCHPTGTCLLYTSPSPRD